MVKIGPRRSVRRLSPPCEVVPESVAPPRLALLIGINYDALPHDSEYAPLRRARSDTKDFRRLLISASGHLACCARVILTGARVDNYEYDPENIVMMLDEEGTEEHLVPTRANIVRISTASCARCQHRRSSCTRSASSFVGHVRGVDSSSSVRFPGPRFPSSVRMRV